MHIFNFSLKSPKPPPPHPRPLNITSGSLTGLASQLELLLLPLCSLFLTFMSMQQSTVNRGQGLKREFCRKSPTCRLASKIAKIAVFGWGGGGCAIPPGRCPLKPHMVETDSPSDSQNQQIVAFRKFLIRISYLKQFHINTRQLLLRSHIFGLYQSNLCK